MTDRTANQQLAALLQEADGAISEAKDYLQSNGITYHLDQWVTVNEYAKQHNLETTSIINDWIARGIIKDEDIRVFPELNNLRLIRNIDYKE